MRKFCLLSCCVLFLLRALTANAQPALERIEEGVRRQVETPPATVAPRPAAIEPGYLGVIADEAAVRGSGVLVREVLPDGPAARGGLQAGDRITAIGGRAVGQVADMQPILKDQPAGTELGFQIERGGNVSTKQVTLGVRPPRSERPFQTFGYIPQGASVAQPGIPPGGPRLGVRTLPLSDLDRQRLGIRASSGARVVAVTPGGPAERAGIPLDAVITGVDGQPVGDPDQLGQYIRAQAPGKQVELTYSVGPQEMHTRVVLGGGEGRAVTPAPQVGLPAFGVDQRPTLAGPSAEERIEQLQRRIGELESRVKWLESQAAPAAPPAPAPK